MDYCAQAAMLVLALACAARGEAPAPGPPAEGAWFAWERTPPPAPEWTIRAEARAWYAAPAGGVKLPGSPGSAGRIDLADLNLDSPRVSPAANLDLRSGPWRLQLDGFTTGAERSVIATGPGQVGTAPFAAGDRVDADLRLVAFEAAAGHRLVDVRRGLTSKGATKISFGLDALAGLRFDEVELSVTTPAGRSRADEWFATPMVGLGIGMEFWERFSFDLRMGAGALPGVDERASAVADIGVGLEWRPVSNVGVRIGYRATALNLRDGDGDAEFDLTGSVAGLYGSLSLRF